jgi:ABC-type multidrug transport system fused ATPase/permease subunit
MLYRNTAHVRSCWLRGVEECRLLRLRRNQSSDQNSQTLLDPPATLWQQGVSLDRVSFTYPGRKRPVVQDVSLHFANGATAIVGPSGSGKSTVAQLLTQVLQPCEGNIKLGDVCMDDISRDWIRNHVAEVPQVRTPHLVADEGMCSDCEGLSTYNCWQREKGVPILIRSVNVCSGCSENTPP